MKIPIHISTIFFISTIASIFLFALIFWFYSNANDQTLILLKDALSTTSGYFGGITTLIAAYIASKLFNDWKTQHNQQVINNFGLQVYEEFSSFEKNLSIYNQYLQQLQGLIDAYGYEINTVTLYTDKNQKYITNITNKMDELKISFYSLYTKFQSYSVVSGTLEVDCIRYDSYLDTFRDTNLFDDDIFNVQDNLNTWTKNYVETLELLNNIKVSEIEELLINLKAK